MSDSGSEWFTEALATRDIERVEPNMGAAGERVNDARRHIRSARLLAEDDPTLAVAACHDAIRKALTAHMAARGLRPRGGEGAHRIVLDYARHELTAALSPDVVDEADEIRKDRGIAEYGDFAARHVDADHVRAAASTAERIVNAVAAELARLSRPSR